MTDNSAIDAKAKEVGADTVLVTKSVGRKIVSGAEPPESIFDSEYVLAEMNIYDMKSSKQVWVASTETALNENIPANKRLRWFVKAVIRRLSKEKLIKQ
jgi:hypothetical protein